MNHIAFIGSASGWGAQIRGTEKGPLALFNSGFLDTINSSWVWKETFFPPKSADEIHIPPGPLTLPYIEDLCKRAALSTEGILQEHGFPVMIGGDHVIAAGTWAGVIHQLKAKERFGLIWIDAHMDAHTMETTPSGAYHGMPLAVLLGFGEPSLVNILEQGPLLNPRHVCLIGTRSYEEGEAALLKRLGVRIYFMEEVLQKGFKTVFLEAISYVKEGTKGFGLSIDLDAFDPLDAPGVGTPEPNGLRAQEALDAFSVIQNNPSFKGLEITEFNPEFDRDGKTLYLLKDILITLLPTKESFK